MIKFRVRTIYNADDFAYYYFRTNTPPANGTCTMDKTVGQAVLEDFVLTCTGWNDVDLPLKYQVNVPGLGSSYVVLAVSSDSSNTLRLPVGDKNDNYNLLLEVNVQDSLLAAAKVNLTVIVSF